MSSIRLFARTEMEAPAAAVWCVLADYSRDPHWRQGVTKMQPEPAGLVRPGTTTDEVLRLGGRTYRSEGIVTEVDEGRSFTWHTTAGTTARGSRWVRPISDGRTAVELRLEVGVHGAQKLMKPLLRRMLGANLAGDAERLRQLVLAERLHAPV